MLSSSVDNFGCDQELGNFPQILRSDEGKGGIAKSDRVIEIREVFL